MPSLYVVKASVPEELVDSWIAWMKTVHVPAMCALPWFIGANIHRVKEPAKGSPTFAMVYEARDRDAIEEYLRSAECVALRAEFRERYGDRVAVTREIWQQV